ncbi:LIM domain transcription factor LMO4.2 [Bagarius yarrelli]|uniref:LIM domain transcription factor LMO4.2 n=1 Tax=Bagarius yarrelli TaxID=175774 RepID=A0A556VY86_BAGYA|nr:LIM domain transcription factor LMO4.2 [Bagarius yarrelli]
MRAQGNVYHLKQKLHRCIMGNESLFLHTLWQCFTCSTCRNRLVPGDRFHYINGSLFCEHDRPTALMNGHLSSLQTNPLLPDQKVNTGSSAQRYTTRLLNTLTNTNLCKVTI